MFMIINVQGAHQTRTQREEKQMLSAGFASVRVPAGHVHDRVLQDQSILSNSLPPPDPCNI